MKKLKNSQGEFEGEEMKKKKNKGGIEMKMKNMKKNK